MGHQNWAPSNGILESPLAKFSNSTYYDSNNLHQPTAIRPGAKRFPQPQWENLAFSDSAFSRPYGLSHPDMNEVQGFSSYQGATNNEDFAFTSTSVEPSSSSAYLSPETACTPFASGDEINGLQPTNAGMQQMEKYEAHTENIFQQPAHHPGRMTSEGDKLTDIFSSPPPRMVSDFGLTLHTYEPSASNLDNSFSTHQSFDGYLPADSSFTPYGDMVGKDLQWRNEDMNYSDGYLPPQDANHFIGNDYNQLSQVPVLSTPLESNNVSFLNLLSSDPIMPEEYQDQLYSEMLAAQDGNQTFLEYSTPVQENPIDQHSLRIARQTPPLLEC
jgi:hypothetical protein